MLWVGGETDYDSHNPLSSLIYHYLPITLCYNHSQQLQEHSPLSLLRLLTQP
jgi:hypothetical protein